MSLDSDFPMEYSQVIDLKLSFLQTLQPLPFLEIIPNLLSMAKALFTVLKSQPICLAIHP